MQSRIPVAAAKMAKFCTEFSEGLSMPSTFKKLTTNYDRCRLLLQQDNIMSKDVVIAEPRKDEAEANKLIKEGETALRGSDRDGALRCFNESLIYAKYGSKLWLQALSNRSLRLYDDAKYLECISDSDLAMEQAKGEKRLEFLQRKWACLQELKCKEATAVLKEAMIVADKLGPDSQLAKRLREQSPNALPASKLTNKLDDLRADSYWDYAVPEVVGGAHKKMPSVSRYLKLVQKGIKGRHMVAGKDLKPGQVVMVEKPLMTIFMAAKRWDFCLNCVHRIQVPVPCRRCDEIAFCSAECRDEAEAFHAGECGLLQNLDDTCHQRIRMAVLFGLDSLREPLDTIHQDDLSAPTDPRHMNNLLGHDEHRTASSNFSQALESIFCFKILEQKGFFEKDALVLSDLDKKAMVVSRLMGFSQKCWVNSFMMAHYRPDTGLTEDIGTAVYSTISLMNHSCFPNCAWVFNGNVNIVRTLKSIKAGEEIQVSYNSFCTYVDVPADKRKERYRRDYFFDCDCKACSMNWGPDTEYNEFPVRGKASFRRACLKTADLAQGTNEYNEEVEKLLHLQISQMDKLMPLTDDHKKPFIEYERCVRAAHACNWMKRDWSTFTNPV